MLISDRDQDPRLRGQAPYEQRFYGLLAAELAPAHWARAAALGLLTLLCLALPSAAGVGGAASGWVYVAGVVLVLASRELGRWLACRVHGLPMGPSYLLPFPVLGCLGSMLRVRAPFKSRRDLFDVALAGPASGFLAALLLLGCGSRFGLEALVRSAWVGLLLTGVSLLPGGPFDGAFLLRALRTRRRLPRFLDAKISPPLDPFRELGRPRRVLGIAALFLAAGCLVALLLVTACPFTTGGP